MNPGIDDGRFGHYCCARSDYNNILVVSVKLNFSMYFVLKILHNKIVKIFSRTLVYFLCHKNVMKLPVNID